MLAVAVKDREFRFGADSLQDAAVVRFAEAPVLFRGMEISARGLDRIEKALDPFAKAGLREGENRLRDRREGVGDGLWVLLEVVGQALAGQLAGEGERAEDGWQRRAVGAPVHDAADERLQ